VRSALRPTVAALLWTFSIAGAQVPAAPEVNDAEFKCMYTAAKAEAKFAVGKAKCITKCFTYAWKGIGTFADCIPPYGGITAPCIFDSTYFRRGVENKFQLQMEKSCVRVSSADCPECYAGGDCVVAANFRVQIAEAIVDSFVPNVFCETTGALPEEMRCQTQTMRALATYSARSHVCYAKCFAEARQNGLPLADCLPPVANSRWYGCLTAARAKAEAYMHKYCHETSTPLAPPECPDAYPDEVQWADQVDYAVETLLPVNYCSE
jgi:hypothetical protein